MSETTPPAGTRGAVDLSSVAGMTAPTAATAGAGDAGRRGRPASRPTSSRPCPAGWSSRSTPSNLQEALNRTLQVPGVLVLWGSAYPQTRELFDTVVRVAASLEGRVLVLSADLSTSPELLQAFQPLLVQAFGQPSVPATFGLLQGQPVPLFPGMAPESEVRAVLDQLLQAAVQNGITGRVELEARRGCRRRRDPAAAARGGLRRDRARRPRRRRRRLRAGAGREPQGPRRRARAGPGAAHAAHRRASTSPPPAPPPRPTPPTSRPPILVADLDLLGGHVEDAFARLLDLVRATSGDERNRARTHLLELFAVVGSSDERVRKGRTALMSALF